ncbi:MAG: diguanylate cyclase [Pelovirga sp.]
MSTGLKQLSSNRHLALPLALLIFLVCFSVGETFVILQERDIRARQHNHTLALTADLRARVEHELNSLLFISSGLGSYLAVRHDDLNDSEVQEILAALHRSSSNIRTFGIAVGYQLTHIYPLEGNHQALGVDYRNIENQWPVVEQIIASGKPALDGPVRLVQDGHGLIYRVPLIINDKYWGFLSTVIDLDRFLNSTFGTLSIDTHEFALRSVVAGRERPLTGNQELFTRAGNVTQSIAIPGGQWLLAASLTDSGSVLTVNDVFRIANILVCVLIAWLMYNLINNRAQLAEIAMYDSLTGLPNRRMLQDRHQQVVARMKRRQTQNSALLFLDLNGFKAVNDTYGHKAGDIVLKETAHRLRSLVRPSDTVARWGGDEFILLLENLKPEQADKLIARLRAIIGEPIHFSGHQLQIAAAFGKANYPPRDISLENIIREADQKMYKEKATAKRTT